MLQQILWGHDWYQSFRSLARNARAPFQVRAWESRERQGPPPHAVKQQVLRQYARSFGLKILVETGTYHGDMLEALKRNFDRLYSIELSTTLFEKAKWRFRNDPKISLINGDSGDELAKLVPLLAGPALFWLDGHYSAGPTAHGNLSTPIHNELRHILTAAEKRHVMVIDDARHFGIEKDYPTVEEIVSFVHDLRPDLEVTIDTDSIRICPRLVDEKNRVA